MVLENMLCKTLTVFVCRLKFCPDVLVRPPKVGREIKKKKKKKIEKQKYIVMAS